MSLESYLHHFQSVLAEIDSEQVKTMIQLLKEAYDKERMIFVIGNGGSAANASHICEDLGKGTLHDFDRQKRLKIMSLTDNTPYILAWANDEGYHRIFIEQLKNLAEHDSILLAISGSGNSRNILEAVDYANQAGLKTVAISGYDGGQLLQKAQYALHVPSFNMGMVESVHLLIFHYIIEQLYQQFKTADR